MSEYIKGKIPFFGFYDTILSQTISDALEQMFQDAQGAVIDDGLHMQAYNDVRWRDAYVAVAKVYCEEFAKWVGLDITFRDLWSPPEYNFITDEIWVYISRDSLLYAHASVDKEILDKEARRQLTSRDGFHSDHDPDITTWPYDVCEWNSVQVAVLMDAVALELTRQEHSKYDRDGEEKHFGQWEQYELLEGPISDGVLAQIVEENCPILVELLDKLEKLRAAEASEGSV